ncbi:MAG: hypothetical protein K2X87_10405 [Gemmataceae bacterium]|nr:hypothetical protein [Gemmataceae bacterium]
MSEFDLFVPLAGNDGTPFGERVFKGIKLRLLEQFDGVTFFPQPNEGYWRMGGVVYRDEVVVFRVVTPKRRSARRFLASLKDELKRVLRQEEILIIERDVKTL